MARRTPVPGSRNSGTEGAARQARRRAASNAQKQDQPQANPELETLKRLIRNSGLDSDSRALRETRTRILVALEKPSSNDAHSAFKAIIDQERQGAEQLTGNKKVRTLQALDDIEMLVASCKVSGS